MRFLCLSDLHFYASELTAALERSCLSDYMSQVKSSVDAASPDAVVITGDIVVTEQVRLLSECLRKLVPGDTPVIVTLGNHEFWERPFEATLAELKEQTVADKNIFYLDLIGAVELGGFNLAGGTLFFDGSMRIRENQRVDEWNGWKDWRIPEITTRYLEFNSYYVDMITASMKPGMPTILCTHHVPHLYLNGLWPDHYSFYIGMKDFVHELPFDPKFDHYLVCGHTHRRVIGELIPGFMCINVGSDRNRLATYTIEA